MATQLKPTDASVTLVGLVEDWTLRLALLSPYVTTLFQMKQPRLLSKCGRVEATVTEDNKFQFPPTLESLAPSAPSTFIVDGIPYQIPTDSARASEAKQQWLVAKRRLIQELGLQDTPPPAVVPVPAQREARDRIVAADGASEVTCPICGKADIPSGNWQMHQLRCRPPVVSKQVPHIENWRGSAAACRGDRPAACRGDRPAAC